MRTKLIFTIIATSALGIYSAYALGNKLTTKTCTVKVDFKKVKEKTYFKRVKQSAGPQKKVVYQSASAICDLRYYDEKSGLILSCKGATANNQAYYANSDRSAIKEKPVSAAINFKIPSADHFLRVDCD